MADRVEIARYRLDDGAVVIFEVDEAAGYHPAGAADITGQVRDAVAPAVDAACIVLEKVRAAAPTEVEVAFGLKVSGEANWWIAKAATEANFQVTLTWKDGDAQA